MCNRIQNNIKETHNKASRNLLSKITLNKYSKKKYIYIFKHICKQCNAHVTSLKSRIPIGQLSRQSYNAPKQ